MTRRSRSNGAKEVRETATAVGKLAKEGEYKAAAQKYGTDVVAYAKSFAKTNRSSIIEKELRDPKRHGLTHHGRGRIVMGSVVVDAEGDEAVFLWVDNGRPQLTTPDLWHENEPQYRRRRTNLQVKNYQPGLSRRNPVDQWEYVIVYSDEGKSGTKQYERFITRKSPGDWLREAVRGDDQEQGNEAYEEYGRNFRQGAPGEWHTQYTDGTGRTWYISILPHSDRSRWALKARRNPMEWILVDVDPVRLGLVVSDMRDQGFSVRTRKTTEGRKSAVGVSVDIPLDSLVSAYDIEEALSFVGTIVGSVGHPTGDRSWATGPKKYTPRVQSPREMAHRGKVAANAEKRGKYSSKPKSKRPWQARNNPRAKKNNPVAIIVAALIPLLVKLGQSQLDRFYSGSRAYQLKKIRQLSKSSPVAWLALKSDKTANAVVDWLVTDEGKMVVEEGLQASATVVKSKARNNPAHVGLGAIAGVTPKKGQYSRFLGRRFQYGPDVEVFIDAPAGSGNEVNNGLIVVTVRGERTFDTHGWAPERAVAYIEKLFVGGYGLRKNPTARPNFFWGKGAKAAATSDDPVYRISYEVWKRPYGIERGSKKLAASKLAEWYHGTLAQPDVAGLRIKSASGGSGGDPFQAIGQLVGVSAKALNNPARRNAGRQPSQYEHRVCGHAANAAKRGKE